MAYYNASTKSKMNVFTATLNIVIKFPSNVAHSINDKCITMWHKIYPLHLTLLEHSDSGEKNSIRFDSRWRIDFSIQFDSIRQFDNKKKKLLTTTMQYAL